MFSLVKQHGGGFFLPEKYDKNHRMAPNSAWTLMVATRGLLIKLSTITLYIM